MSFFEILINIYSFEDSITYTVNIEALIVEGLESGEGAKTSNLAMWYKAKIYRGK